MKCLTSFCIVLMLGAIAQSRTPGSAKEVDPNSKQIKELLDYAIENRNGEPITVTAISRATTRVVSGTLFTIDFLGMTEDSNTQVSCRTELVVKPWVSPDPKVKSFTCAA